MVLSVDVSQNTIQSNTLYPGGTTKKPKTHPNNYGINYT
jgi:hypothetical protein